MRTTPAVIGLIAFVWAPSARATVVIDVRPASAPNSLSSPSYPAWRDNAIAALLNGSTSGGTPGQPSFYSQVPNNSSLPPAENIVSDFPSWRGRANPGATFGAAFAGEHGNRLAFGLLITRGAGDAPFRIADLSFVMTSNNPSFGFTFAPGSYDYSANFVGILFGPNGALGGGDDTFITTGANTQFVDAIVGRGTGTAPAALSSDPGPTDQNRLDAAALASGNYFLTGTYSLGSATGGATVFFGVPEPGTVTLSLVALAAGVVLARRRKVRAT